MHITILALGSRGDVQPYIALGRGLKRAGYAVQFGAPENFHSLAAQYGLDFFAIAPNSREIMASETGRRMMTTGDHAPAFMYELARMVSAYADECLTRSLKACEHTDAILFNSFALMGFHIAEALNLPSAGAWIYPLNRTAHYPSMGTPPFLGLGGPFNWLTYLIDEQIIQHAFRHIFRQWRKTLDLPPLPISGFYDYLYRQNIPQIYGYSSTVVPRPIDWPDRFVVSGYWFLDQIENFKPPTELCDFLDAGPPPVYIGFGSVVGNQTAHLTEMVLSAVKHSGQRVILAKGWGGLDTQLANRQMDEQIFVVDDVPHDWLFPKMAAVIHHGGAGTTASGMRAGVPTVIVPFSGDQPFWGKRVRALRAGPSPIPHTRLNAERLGAAITSAVNDEVMREHARLIGESIRAEDGIARAVEAFERYVIKG
jgi:sterol 3beta-glucosyltransferase